MDCNHLQKKERKREGMYSIHNFRRGGDDMGNWGKTFRGTNKVGELDETRVNSNE